MGRNLRSLTGDDAMSDQTIKPVSPANRTRDVIKKKKRADQKLPQQTTNKEKDPELKKNGIIDTYV
jgi:hypothetical protein